jgi:hypothetical protein
MNADGCMASLDDDDDVIIGWDIHVLTADRTCKQKILATSEKHST